MARIRVIESGDATGRLREIYDDIFLKRGKLAEVHKIQSLRPESIVNHMDLYMEIMFTKSDLSRAEREMMAVVVSVSNGCEYCRLHHAEALNHYWKDDLRISSLSTGFKNAGLSEKETLLCRFARELTLRPESFHKDSMIEDMKNTGLTDNAILDATLVVAYFNFVNRIVLALGVESDPEELRGYNF
ncbi:MAG: peroxidase-related enzyme [Bacteroidales bacterium]